MYELVRPKALIINLEQKIENVFNKNINSKNT